jgi:hypothetical protein
LLGRELLAFENLQEHLASMNGIAFSPRKNQSKLWANEEQIHFGQARGFI